MAKTSSCKVRFFNEDLCNKALDNRKDHTVDLLDKYKLTPLFYAVQGGNVEAVRLLLEARASANARSSLGVDLIWHAAYNKILNKEIFKLLLECGADPNTLNPEGKNIVAFLDEERSILDNVEDVIKLFSPSSPYMLTNRLHAAIKNGEIENFYDCLEKGADLGKTDPKGNHVLVQVLDTEKPELALEMLRELIKRDCDPTDPQHKVKCRKGNGTLLHLAAFSGLNEVVTFLLENKWFSINESDYIGRTPLYFATKGKHNKNETVKLLLNAGARNCYVNAELSPEDRELRQLFSEYFNSPNAQRLAVAENELSKTDEKSEEVFEADTRKKQNSTEGFMCTVDRLCAESSTWVDYFASFLSRKKNKTDFYLAIRANNIKGIRDCLKDGVSVRNFSLAERHILSEEIKKPYSVLKYEIRLELFNYGFESRRLSLSELSEGETQALIDKVFVRKRVNLSKINADEIRALKLDILEFFEKIDIDLTDLFHLAIHFGAKKIFQFCLENLDKVACTRLDLKGHSALYNAVNTKKTDFALEMIKALIERGCDPKKEKSLLHQAAYNGLNDVLTFLLKKGDYSLEEQLDIVKSLQAGIRTKRDLLEKLSKKAQEVRDADTIENQGESSASGIQEPIASTEDSSIAAKESEQLATTENEHETDGKAEEVLDAPEDQVPKINEEEVIDIDIINDQGESSSGIQVPVASTKEPSLAAKSEELTIAENKHEIDEKTEEVLGAPEDQVPKGNEEEVIDIDVIKIQSESSSANIQEPIIDTEEPRLTAKESEELTTAENEDEIDEKAEEVVEVEDQLSEGSEDDSIVTIEEDEVREDQGESSSSNKNPPNPNVAPESSRLPSLFAILTSIALTGVMLFGFGVSMAVAAVTFVATTIAVEVLHRHLMNQPFSASNGLESEPNSSASMQGGAEESKKNQEKNSKRWTPSFDSSNDNSDDSSDQNLPHQSTLDASSYQSPRPTPGGEPT